MRVFRTADPATKAIRAGDKANLVPDRINGQFAIVYKRSLYFLISITNLYGRSHSLERSHRPPHKAVRSALLQAAVETGSMWKVAADLAISRPAVSYAVAEMEHALGVPLLGLTSQGATPTAYGRPPSRPATNAR